ncbi:unnamed protein product [Dibothriocephalus latus]|uniref:G-protein coupled receptors family 1 profile domain-containing protein n=1 Tax=Dibothriocephalus latus TaxID=60516 RepID=A0A3P6PGL7_DIBLA|nr:unnamed protein product [Dibothriocephalus latus]
MQRADITDWPYIDSPWDLFLECDRYNSTVRKNFGACIIAHMLGIVSAYIFPFIGAFGLISNFLVLYVFFFVYRKPTRQMIYLGSIAGADILTLITFGWIWLFPAKGLPYATLARVYFFIFNFNDVTCKVFRYAYSFTASLSSSLFLLTALDRCLSIYFPLRFSRISTRRAWEAVLIITLVSALAMLPFGLMVGHSLSQGKIICWVLEQKTFLQIYHVLLSNSSLLQTLLVIGVNIALVVRLRRAVSERRSMSNCTTTNREIAASMLLVMLSGATVMAALPQSIAYALSSILAEVLHGDEGLTIVRLVYNISDLCWHILFLQQALNWVLYMKRMKNFREQTLRLLRCRRQASRGLHEESFSSMRVNTRKLRLSVLESFREEGSKIVHADRAADLTKAKPPKTIQPNGVIKLQNYTPRVGELAPEQTLAEQKEITFSTAF